MRKYQLCVNQYGYGYNGTAPLEVAKLIECSSNKDALICYYDKEFCAKHGYPFSVDQTRTVHMNDEYKKILYENTLIFEALVLHELGHIEKGHFTCGTTTASDKMIRQSRKLSIQEGHVSVREAEADAFAISEVGTKRMIDALSFLIEKRKKINDANAKLAIREMELRIFHIKNRMR